VARRSGGLALRADGETRMTSVELFGETDGGRPLSTGKFHLVAADVYTHNDS